jgi:hypothetical protein
LWGWLEALAVGDRIALDRAIMGVGSDSGANAAIGQGRDTARRRRIRALRNKANSSQDPEMPNTMSKGPTPIAPPWFAAGLGALIVFPFKSVSLAEKKRQLSIVRGGVDVSLRLNITSTSE